MPEHSSTTFYAHHGTDTVHMCNPFPACTCCNWQILQDCGGVKYGDCQDFILIPTITGAWAVAGMGDQSWPNICPAFLVYSSREIVLTPSWTWGRAAEEYGCCMPSIYIEEGPWSYLWPVRSCRAGIGVLEGMEGIQGMV